MVMPDHLPARVLQAHKILTRCRLCGHACGQDRTSGQSGPCRAGLKVKVAAHLLHHGEEPPLSGVRGSGTIFFSHCPLLCVFCQNYQISQGDRGKEISGPDLADLMLDLQSQGAYNINLVSPTPWVPQIIEALHLARQQGLALPVVYNTGGFDSPAALKMLDGLIDIYLPDAKYAGGPGPEIYSGAAGYVAVNQRAIREMYRQTGPLKMDEEGMATSGVLIRHLVLPGNLDDTEKVLAWLTAEFGVEVYVSLMAQYLPFHLAAGPRDSYPELARRLTEAEYERAIDAALGLDMENVFIQELEAADIYVPDFQTRTVFSRTSD